MNDSRAGGSRGRGWLVPCLLGVAGCGEYGLADESYPVEPVVILEGELRARGGGQVAMNLAWAPDLEAAERLTTALLRRASSCGMEREALLQPLTFQEHYPSGFTLPLSTTPPPAAQLALEPLGGQGRLTLGWAVFFKDDNANGLLDMGGAGTKPERVVATSLDSGLAVLFLDGAPPPGRSEPWTAWPREVPQGFSLLSVSRSTEFAPFLVVRPPSTRLSLEDSRSWCP